MTEKFEATPHLPIEVLAKLLGLGVPALKDLRKNKIVKAPARRGQWPVSVVTEYVEYLRQSAAGDISEDAHAQRTRLLKEQADKLEMENALTRAVVVRIEDVARQWELILGDVRTRFLALPTKLAPLVAVEDKQKIVEEMLENGVHSALGQLATGISVDAGSDCQPGLGVEIEYGKTSAATEN